MEEEPLDQISKAFAAGMTRRRAVKLVALSIFGGAGALAGARAASGAHVHCTTAACQHNPCGTTPLAICGVNPHSGECLCSQTVLGGCACFQPICLPNPHFCDHAHPHCPAGYACVNAQCCGVSFCAALCETTVATTGVTTAGATTTTITRWA